jgi:ParD-like antitoxin of type II bacterial toxin-antitoxin system
MSQPVKLSDALVLDARMAGEAQERSIAGQVEFWAKLGRGVELLLDGQRVLSLCRTVGVTPLSELVEIVDTPKGRDVFVAYLKSEPYPHYEGHPTREGLLVRTEENGRRTVGRFVNRVFVAERAVTSKRVDAARLRPARSKSKTSESAR